MRIAIMQPYWFPYIGYFQLMNAVDEFVVYDNIEFTKKGWINRNRILVNGADAVITLPLRKDSDFLEIRQRQLAEVWPEARLKLLNRITEAYRKAPCFDSVFPVLRDSIMHEEANLFGFILNSLLQVRAYVGITVPLVISSSIPIDHHLKAADKVMAICRARGADAYINPIGGMDLYSKQAFKEAGVVLTFLKTSDFTYPQLGHAFVPFLSIIDVMMFNPPDRIREILATQFTLL